MTASRTYSTAVVYTLFIFTGVGVVLPGALLPLILATFALHDGQGGTLLLASFVGSALGAVLARGKLPYSMARGGALAALGAVCLAYAATNALLLSAIFLFGVGLGISMTSASLLQSRNHATERSTELTRMNLLWSLGATTGPWLGLHGATKWGFSRPLIALAVLFLVLGGMAAFSQQHGRVEPDASAKIFFSKRAALLLLLAIPLATGIEAAVGGWLTTYAERLRGTLNFTVAAGTCFWAGMLVSRFSQSFPRVAARSKRSLLVLGPVLMVCGFLLLLFSRGAFVAAGACLLGLGAGPMYPLLLSWSLSSGERSNIAFVSAGCGASLLPFLTGQISGRFGDLRSGLALPFSAAVAMLITCVVIRRDLFQEVNRGA